MPDSRSVPPINLGILAHVDAGKTSLTERLLYTAGVIDTLGRVDDGSTQTDTLELERRRGITIKSAVVSFTLGGTRFNLIDTPGHPDFIAEVERVLGVLDAAVLVVSAVEGVQAQTRVLMRALQRLRVPTLLFVNKIDRGGADPDRVTRALAAKLSPVMLPMAGVRDAGSAHAAVVAGGGLSDDERVNLLAERDEGLLAAFVAGTATPEVIAASLRGETAQARAHPVFFGSAITGAGVPELIEGLSTLLRPEPTPDGPPGAAVFKVDRGPAGERVAFVRMVRGTLRVRDRFPDRAGRPRPVTAISVFDEGADVGRDAVRAGEIAKVWGLPDVQIGDEIGVLPDHRAVREFAPPTLATVVSPVRERDRGALFAALTELGEQDPLIDVRRDEERSEISVSLYGEVQKEVIEATLAAEYGLHVTFAETTTVCIERLVGIGEAAEAMKEPGNPFLATIGLRVAPAAIGSGITFRVAIELGALPVAFLAAIEDTVRASLAQGLSGWQIPDCEVTLIRSGYAPRQSHMHQRFNKSMSSTGSDFRHLTPLVLTSALRRATTVVCAPVHRFRLAVPASALTAVLAELAAVDAVPRERTSDGVEVVLAGDIPSARVHELERRLPGLTSGEGELTTEFDRYDAVAGPAPQRDRIGPDPRHRTEYLLQIQRRVLT